MAILFSTSGFPREVTPKDGGAFSLEELQALIEGPLECIYLPDGRLLFLNEEGKYHRLPLNVLATALAWPVLLPGDVIVGPAVVMSLQEAGE